MIEPFVDINDTGTRMHYTRFNNYIDLRISDLPRFGLKPVLVFEDYPHKITIGQELVVSEVV